MPTARTGMAQRQGANPPGNGRVEPPSEPGAVIGAGSGSAAPGSSASTHRHREFNPDKDCGAKTNPIVGEKPCKHQKGWGTKHKGAGQCRLHGGTTPNGKRHAATEAATAALGRLGQAITTNPQQALLDLVSEAAGNVAFLREQAAQFGVHLVLSTSEVSARKADHTVDDGEEIIEVFARTVTLREDVKAIVKLYGEWCDRLAKYAAEAIKAGIAEREIAFIESQADLVARVIVRSLEGLPDDEFERRKNLAMDELVAVKAIPAGSRN